MLRTSDLRDHSSQIVTNVSEIFGNEENFDRNSEEIAGKFQESIGRRFQMIFI